MKYRFQNPSPNVRYLSTFHALATIAREERLRGLFKGISSPLVRLAILPTGKLYPPSFFKHEAERISIPCCLRRP